MSLNSIAIILFDNFETLDVMGPVEVFGSLKDCQIVFISPSGEPMAVLRELHLIPYLFRPLAINVF
ncbi:hypothetical protein AB7092_00470 [Providencia rettgeri]|uniref:hypothetical protein n=1 Tax=Providencia TaxID=586 RepID=UPI0022730DA4|nr:MULTISPECIES: hypothetical protein [unclassified Providencia]MDB9566667.1 hypothetical protein [Providencia rettgeri]WOB89204.1 hypothetical protein P3L44_10715 [Providencia sp. PROV175]